MSQSDLDTDPRPSKPRRRHWARPTKTEGMTACAFAKACSMNTACFVVRSWCREMATSPSEAKTLVSRTCSPESEDAANMRSVGEKFCTRSQRVLHRSTTASINGFEYTRTMHGVGADQNDKLLCPAAAPICLGTCPRLPHTTLQQTCPADHKPLDADFRRMPKR